MRFRKKSSANNEILHYVDFDFEYLHNAIEIKKIGPVEQAAESEAKVNVYFS